MFFLLPVNLFIFSTLNTKTKLGVFGYFGSFHCRPSKKVSIGAKSTKCMSANKDP